MGLRYKLLVYVISFTVAVVAAYGLTTIHGEEEIHLREMEARAITILKSFAISCAVAMANHDTPTLDNYTIRYYETATELDLRYLAVLDYTGRVVSHTSQSEFAKLYEDPFTKKAIASDTPVMQVVPGASGDTRDAILEVAVPVVSGLRWGTLRAGFTLAKVDRTIETRTRQILWLGLVLLVVIGTIAYAGLSRVVIRPILHMSAMAQRFGEGHLESRVQLEQSDEVGQLAQQLNRMAQQIQDYTGSLERLVQERTQELASANQQLVEANVQLERLAKTDALTGLYNRRQFMEQLDFEIRRGARNPHQFTLILLDVDHFKHFNDTHGHTAGDELLQRLAALMQLNLRGTDLIARYGGEEFVVMLLDTGPEEGHATAKKLQQVVAAQPFPHEETQPLGMLTISVGVAFYPQDSRDGRKLVDYADRALYKSKERGRNTVTRWSEISAQPQSERA